MIPLFFAELGGLLKLDNTKKWIVVIGGSAICYYAIYKFVTKKNKNEQQ